MEGRTKGRKRERVEGEKWKGKVRAGGRKRTGEKKVNIHQGLARAPP